MAGFGGRKGRMGEGGTGEFGESAVYVEWPLLTQRLTFMSTACGAPVREARRYSYPASRRLAAGTAMPRETATPKSSQWIVE